MAKKPAAKSKTPAKKTPAAPVSETSGIKIHCKYDKLVDPATLKDHPKNRNKHTKDQVARLVKIYKSTGIRHPIVVSNLSGCIGAGHGRKQAAIEAGIKEFPVVYQNFKNSEEEYAFMVSDNAIALWADLDLAGINADLADLGPDFDLDDLGILNFKMDFSEHGVLPDGRSLKDTKETYDPMNIKQITLIFDEEEYLRAIDIIEKIKTDLSMETNTQAVMHLLEEYAAK